MITLSIAIITTVLCVYFAKHNQSKIQLTLQAPKSRDKTLITLERDFFSDINEGIIKANEENESFKKELEAKYIEVIDEYLKEIKTAYLEALKTKKDSYKIEFKKAKFKGTELQNVRIVNDIANVLSITPTSFEDKGDPEYWNNCDSFTVTYQVESLTKAIKEKTSEKTSITTSVYR